MCVAITESDIEARYPRLAGNAWIGVPKGWLSLVDRMCGEIEAALSDDQAERFRLRAIEEKYCIFRIQYDNGPDEDCIEYDAVEIAEPIMERYEKASGQTCGVCGFPGRVVDRYYMPTCPEHDRKR